VVWAVGVGNSAQTYIVLFGRHYVESEISYYTKIRALGVTVGHNPQAPRSLDAAMGLPISDADLAKCLNCHATSALRDGRLTLNQMVPGIGCERCHGPGANHLAAIKAGNLNNLQIVNPTHFGPEKGTAFCATCHRSTEDVKQLGTHGVGNVRFEAYRLGRSRCYNPDDPRTACTTCHDPHAARDRTAASYDARCLACHDGKSANAHVCAAGTRECVTCHMPKVEMPGSHATFADHWIRIAKADGAYPD
jgi:hypothetical protein